MKKIIFIQPTLPKYRVSFFNELNKLHSVEVQYSKIDFLGVKAFEDASLNFQTKQLGRFLTLFNKVYWQKGINIFSYNKNNIVVVSGNPRVINNMLLLIVCKLRGIPVIWWGQGWTANSNKLLSKIRFQMMKVADGVAVYTESEANKLTQIRNIVGLNNGLDVKELRFHNLSESYQAEQRTSGVLNILFIGRLTEKANIKLLLKSLLLVKRDFHLHLIGDGSLLPFIKKFIDDNNLESKVTIHGGIYEDKKIGDIASICDCFIYPGSVGLSLIHAFALGLPAIIHDDSSRHMPEVAAFKENYNGLNFACNDKYSLAKTIDSIKTQDLNVLKKNAYNTVTNTYNTKDMALRFSSLIKSL